MLGQRYNQLSREQHEGRGLDYFMSTSDLLLGLIFIFILLFVVMSTEHSRQLDSLRQGEKAVSEERLRQGEKAVSEERARLAGVLAARNELLRNIESDLKRGGVDCMRDEEKGVLRLPEDMLFDTGSADFKEAGREKLRVLARIVGPHLVCFAASTPAGVQACPKSMVKAQLDAILIEGHTDHRPINTQQYRNNLELSLYRARNTHDELLKANGALKEYLNQQREPLFSFGAYGDSRPISKGLDEGSLRTNRRIDLRFVISVPHSRPM